MVFNTTLNLSLPRIPQPCWSESQGRLVSGVCPPEPHPVVAKHRVRDGAAPERLGLPTRFPHQGSDTQPTVPEAFT